MVSVFDVSRPFDRLHNGPARGALEALVGEQQGAGLVQVQFWLLGGLQRLLLVQGCLPRGLRHWLAALVMNPSMRSVMGYELLRPICTHVADRITAREVAQHGHFEYDTC
eukprot:1155568-Pelagomonas_calceolata.AAC.4